MITVVLRVEAALPPTKKIISDVAGQLMPGMPVPEPDFSGLPDPVTHVEIDADDFTVSQHILTVLKDEKSVAVFSPGTWLYAIPESATQVVAANAIKGNENEGN